MMTMLSNGHFRHRSRSYSVDRIETDFSDLDLPPLETFATPYFQGPDCVSLRADSIELEKDVFPSTPLTEEQLAQEVDLGVPINQVYDYKSISIYAHLSR